MALVGFLVWTRDPVGPLTIALVILGTAIAVAGATSVLGLTLEERSAAAARPRRRMPRRGRALRRGIGAGVLVAALGLLRAVDGLTLVTGGFVITGFVLAELVLLTRPTTPSG